MKSAAAGKVKNMIPELPRTRAKMQAVAGDCGGRPNEPGHVLFFLKN